VRPSRLFGIASEGLVGRRQPCDRALGRLHSTSFPAATHVRFVRPLLMWPINFRHTRSPQFRPPISSSCRRGYSNAAHPMSCDRRHITIIIPPTRTHRVPFRLVTRELGWTSTKKSMHWMVMGGVSPGRYRRGDCFVSWWDMSNDSSGRSLFFFFFFFFLFLNRSTVCDGPPIVLMCETVSGR